MHREVVPSRVAPLALAVASAFQLAHAQQPAQKLEKIEITGSRIISSDVESPSPVAIIRAEDVKLEGFQHLELLLNNFPQFVGDQGNRVSNFATGTATADLRGAGAASTLVLLNGRRLPAGTPNYLSPDLNQIPGPLVSRVEILTGGAAAIYGADALAGVVNFILNDRFEGVQGDVAYDFYNHEQKNRYVTELVRARGFEVPGDKGMDGATTSTSLAIGGNLAGGKGNITTFFRYLKSDALLQSERDYSACAVNFSRDFSTVFCGGSGTSYPGRFTDVGPIPPTVVRTPLLRWTIDPGSGRIRPFATSTDLYNFAPTNYYQRPAERYQVHAFANYDLTSAHRVYSEFGFHQDHTVAQIAPSGSFGTLVAVRWENPLLTDEWRSRLRFWNGAGEAATGPGTIANIAIERRNVEGGARQDDLRHASFREVLGMKGEFAGHWDYNLYFQSSKVIYQEEYRRDFSISRIARALDVVADPRTGAAICASALNGTDPGCVPYNIWTLGGVGSAALAYLETPGFQNASLSQQIISATIAADLGDYGIRIPKSRGVEVALGLERRSEKLRYDEDVAFSSNDLAGQGPRSRPTNAGAFTIEELFAEARLPVLDLVNLSGSYRYSRYSTGRATNTFGLGFNAQPIAFARFRGSYQRAVREPNLNELFTPQFQYFYDPNFPADSDPCSGETPIRSLADCQRTGVTAAQYGHIPDSPFGAAHATAGGNPQLRPESGHTLTLGLVLATGKNASMTVDYFDIRIEDTIGEIDAGTIFQQCIDTGDPIFCRLISRDRERGTLWLEGANTLATLQNLGEKRISGVDAAANFRFPVAGSGVIRLDLVGSYLRKWSISLYPHGGTFACEGTFYSVCFRPLPKWRHRARVMWETPWDLDVAATWRYIHRVANASEGVALLPELKPMNYLDLAATWNVAKRFAVRAGINNVLDRDPPVTNAGPATNNGNVFVNSYDALGRHVFVSLTARF